MSWGQAGTYGWIWRVNFYIWLGINNMGQGRDPQSGPSPGHRGGRLWVHVPGQWFLGLPQLLHSSSLLWADISLGSWSSRLGWHQSVLQHSQLVPSCHQTHPLPPLPPLAKFSTGSRSSKALFLAALDGWEQLCLWPEPLYLSNLKAALKFLLPFLLFVSWRYVELKIKWFKSGSRLNNLGQGMFQMPSRKHSQWLT